MKKKISEFTKTKDLLAGYIVGIVDGKLKEVAYADQMLFCEEEVLKTVIKNIVMAFAKGTGTDHKKIAEWILEEECNDVNQVIVDLRKDGKVH